MALFSKDTKKTEEAKKSVVKTSSKKAREATPALKARAAVVITAPWISEKALIGTDKGVYVFAIPRTVTKLDVSRAIETLYKVVPRKVHVVNLPGKRVSSRTRRGTAIRARRRKAYVYLAKGDTIQFA
ncbi:hypothetical protein MNBD_BACTEROID07-578 [hydrothermal vent metagenome]|uniref:LSU ribosomal protein L23p (L23Ae) n=1 Tax=hydrothermal vent metagenome TaxID=652676 RepID=A0A3B0UP11_9ZZZZ